MKKVLTLALVPLALASLAGSAAASDPVSVSVYPAAVQYLPSKDAATEVFIWGAFAFNKGDFAYTAPACGAVHYKCGADKDLALCRMQWKEIESTIGETNCRGYGQRNVAPKVTLHAADKVLSTTADVWDLGIGTSPVYGLGNCPTMQTMKCEGPSTPPPPPKDAGPPEVDAGPPPPPPPADAGKPIEDTNVTPPPPPPPVDAGSTTPPTPTPDAGGPPAAAPTAGDDDVGFGCNAGGGSASLGGAMALLAALGLVRRRRD